MNTSVSNIRFHSLDALRGWAMLLGIVLHTAWIMAASRLGTPIADVDGNYVYNFILFHIHGFRLQTFFVMAGFFAHLVVLRRSETGFIWHRVTRIGIPLVVGSVILIPIMITQMTAGGLASGRVLSDQGLWQTSWTTLVTILTINPSMFGHLWFLYDLLVIYALALLLRSLLKYVIDRRGVLRGWTLRAFGRLIRSPWSIIVLSVPSGLLLFFEERWIGISGGPTWFIPQWQGLLNFFLFFAVGWLLYSNWKLLATLSEKWQRKLILGTAIAIPLFLANTWIIHYGTPSYPNVSEAQILNMSDFHAAAHAEPSTAQYMVWNALSPSYRDFLTGKTELTSDQKSGLSLELNMKVIGNSEFYSPATWEDVELPGEILAMTKNDDARQEAKSQVALLNRRLLELALPNSLMRNGTPSYAKLLKFAFGTGYAIMMWCLVFGVIGAFYNLFPNASPTSRYIADSSYWVYLLHLPVMFQIELWIAGSHWGFWGIPKFIVYNVGTAAVCFLTYHYCVRSTLIGRVLNGRKYPFVPLFGKRPVAESVPASPAIPAPNFRLTSEQRDAAVAPHSSADRLPSVPTKIDLEEA
jgi:peptidoglycan/LPS O-acetylase OafA/YrhL